MIFNLRKILIRTAVGVVMASILGYIFWPQSEPEVKTTDSTSLPAKPDVKDAPCLVLYQKDKDITVLKDTPCIATYIEKYNSSYYVSLNIICRSSGDGKQVNRNSLSEKRMKALQFNLMKLGVDYDNIIAESIGDKEPYPGVDPLSDDGKVLNRSCEITGNK